MKNFNFKTACFAFGLVLILGVTFVAIASVSGNKKASKALYSIGY
jgi:hypothetical protein